MKYSFRLLPMAVFLLCISTVANAYIETDRVETTAGSYTYTPLDPSGLSGINDNYLTDRPSNFDNLNGQYAYTWGFNHGLDLSKVEITSAKITFLNIRNWDRSDYTLHLSLLNLDNNNEEVPIGINKIWDGDRPGDKLEQNYDSDNRKELNVYSSADAKFINGDWNDDRIINYWYTGWDEEGSDITYDFSKGTNSEISFLNAFAADGTIGLGFDPDCHFYNSGISFSLTTALKPPSDVPEPTTMLLFGTGLAALAGLRRKRNKS